MKDTNRINLVLLLVAVASLSSLITLALAPSSAVHAQGLVTTRTPPEAPAAAPAIAPAVGMKYAISSYGYVEPPRTRKDESQWTLGFFALNQETGAVANCIYMWSGTPMNKCVPYGWVKLP